MEDDVETEEPDFGKAESGKSEDVGALEVICSRATHPYLGNRPATPATSTAASTVSTAITSPVTNGEPN
jgi:hypothetical protein